MQGHFYKPRCNCEGKCLCGAACNAVISEHEHGVYAKETNATFESFSREWLHTYATSGLKENTVRIRTYELSKLLTKLAKLRLKDITHSQYQMAMSYMPVA